MRPAWWVVIARLALLALLVLLVIGAEAVTRWHNRTAREDDARLEVADLEAASHRRPLTNDEFDRAVEFVTTGPPGTKLIAVLAVDMAIAQTPYRRDRAVAALEACQRDAPAEVREVATQVVSRLNVPLSKRGAEELTDAALNRGLTDAEWDRATALLSADTESAQLGAVRALVIDVGRNPARRARVITALEECHRTGLPAAREEAGQAAGRLKGPPPAPPTPPV
jgi:hypothetical protein